MKKTIIILLAISLLIISGCTFSSMKIKLPGSTPSGKEDFAGGSKGLESSIVSPAEAGKAYLNTPFKIVIQLNNEGESAAEGTTCAFGSFSTCECKTFTLQGKRRVEAEKLEGEKETLTFEGGQASKEEIEGTSHFVTAKTRYNYKTYGIITACVKKDVYSEETGECKIMPGKNVVKSVSSAPVSIAEVTEEMIPEADGETAKLVFGIKIKNLGKGNIYPLDGDKTQCETTYQEIKNRINVRMINAPGKATCNEAELKKEGEATTHCTVENVKILGESYEPEITLELEYAYETIDSNKFEVV
jgi:hypothetical protein